MVEIGDTIKIISMNGEPQYTGKVGEVTRIGQDCDGQTQIHGTWGGCAIYPSLDEFEIIKKGGKK